MTSNILWIYPITIIFLFFLIGLFSPILIRLIDSRYKKVYKILYRVFIIILIITASLITLGIVGSILWGIYSLVYEILKFLKVSNKLSAYLSLTLTLIITCYYPQKVIAKILLVFERLIDKIMNLRAKEKIDRTHKVSEPFFYKIVLVIRFKLAVYFILIILTLLTTSNKLGLQMFLNVEINIVFESVITFIAIDSFVSIYKDEITGIRKDLSKALGYFRLS